MYAPPSTSAPLAALSNGANAKSVSPVPSAPPPPQQQQPSSQPPPPYATLPPQQQQLQLQQQQLLLQQQHYVLPPYPSSAQSILQQMQKGSTGGAGGKAPWTPDPSIGHLLNLMRKAGPRGDSVTGGGGGGGAGRANAVLAGGEGGGVGEGGGDLDPEEEFEFMEQLLQSRELNALVKAHNVILFCNQEQCPCVSNCCEIASEVMEDVRPYALMIEECRELYAILTTPHIRCLMASHDIVAQRDYLPKLGEIPLEVDEDEETVKMVQLVKSQEPLGDGKSAEPIVGATIKAEEGSGRILIARVMHGGAADRSGLISVGDEVIEVNGIPVEGKSPNDVLQILQKAEDTITFKLIPAETRMGAAAAVKVAGAGGAPGPVRESRVRLRALFDYDPKRDPNIPCQDAGLGFSKGDILHIVSQEDPFWWQARREQDRTMRAGLIPSRQLQERRILNQRDEVIKKQMRDWNAAHPSCLFTCGMGDAMAAWAAGGAGALGHGGGVGVGVSDGGADDADAPYAPSSALEAAFVRAVVPRVTDPITAELRSPADCAESALGAAAAPCLAPLPLLDEVEKSQNRAKKVMYTASESDDFDREEVATYEAVARLFPRAGFFRPVVLVGPPGVGRNEIKRRIIAMDPDRFRMTIPHTTRAPRAGETHGQDYFFVSHEQMRAAVDAGRFLEHGEFRGNLYGTSVDGVKELQEAGLQPVLTPHYQALKKLRVAEIKPFIVYVKAPPFDRLVETRTRTYARSTFVENGNRAFTDEEFRAMLRAGERMEFWYGHWFDLTVVNDELDRAFAEVARAVHRMDQDAQWVPEAWVQ